MRIAEYGAENRDDLIALADAVLGKGFFGNPSEVGRSSNSSAGSNGITES